MFKSKNITQEKTQKQEKTMDEIISLILRGCRLAKDLEINLQSLSNQPENLSKLCEEITRVFIDARERLNAHQQQDPTSLLYPHHHHMLFREAQELQHQQQVNIDHPSLQEWLSTSYTPAMELLHQTQLMAEQRSGGIQMGSSTGGVVIELGGGRDIQATDTSDSGRGGSSSSSLQRPRRRNDDGKKRTIRVPAHQFGNTEIPPEDGFTWRKYGQKEILGSRYPRGYYRCTHQKLYHCSAKKQVQRLDDDPYTFEITYRGEHTCHMSATAPSVPPPPPPPSAPEFTQEMAQPMTSALPSSSATSSVARWLEFSLGGGAGGSTTAGSSSSVAVGLTGGAGPSTVGRYGKEGADSYITDMADVMFNSGSSSTNSMELIFPSMEDKWDQPGDKKN